MDGSMSYALQVLIEDIGTVNLFFSSQDRAVACRDLIDAMASDRVHPEDIEDDRGTVLRFRVKKMVGLVLYPMPHGHGDPV